MNKDESNRKLAEWLGVPCWNEMVVDFEPDSPYVATLVGECSLCNKDHTNPDYYTPEGFFALLDGLATKQFNINVEFYGDTFYYIKLAQTDEWTAFGQNADLPAALVEAALQAMENENG